MATAVSPFRRVRSRRYPIWSVPGVTAVAASVVAVTAAAVFLLGHRSLLLETDTALAIVAVSLACFLAVGLYRGARVRKDDVPSTEFAGVSFGRLGEAADALDPTFLDASAFDTFATGEGCLGAILSVVLSVVVLVALAVLLWLLVNVGVVVVLVLFLALAWVFCRALRQVFRHSRGCRGRVGPSLGYAALYSCLYTGWLFALVHVAHYLLHHHPVG